MFIYLSAFSLAAFWKEANVEEVSTDLCLLVTGVELGPVGVLVILLLRLPHPFNAPLVLGPCNKIIQLN